MTQTPDNMSTTTYNGNAALDLEEMKKLLKKVSKIEDVDEMKMFIFKHQDDLTVIPTITLNHHNKIKGYRFNKRHGALGFFVYNVNPQLEITKQLEERITKLEKIITILIDKNNLIYEEI
jgi:hypothetical protein